MADGYVSGVTGGLSETMTNNMTAAKILKYYALLTKKVAKPAMKVRIFFGTGRCSDQSVFVVLSMLELFCIFFDCADSDSSDVSLLQGERRNVPVVILQQV